MVETIFRIQKKDKFSIISNDPINDIKLSLEALGLLTYLLSKPNDWTVRNRQLEKRFSVGEYKLGRVIKELINAGYMQRNRKHSEKGFFQWETLVFESSTIPQLSTDGLSTDGLSTDGKPQYIISTESPSTELLNTDVDSSSASRSLTDFYLCHVNPRGKHSQQAADILNNITSMYPAAAIKEAVSEAIKAGANNLQFIEAVCKRIASGQERKSNGQSKRRSNRATNPTRAAQSISATTTADIEREIARLEEQIDGTTLAATE